MVDEDSGPELDAGFGTVPVGADATVPFGRGKGAEVKMTLPVVPDIPVGKTEPVPKGGAVVLAVGNGAWPELRIGDPVVCVPVPRVTLLPGGMPCPVGPMLPVAFEIGNGAELGSVLVGPPASPLLPVGAIVDIAVVAAEPVPRGLVGFETPVEFESGNGAASDGLLCNGWVGLGIVVEFDMVKGTDPVQLIEFDIPPLGVKTVPVSSLVELVLVTGNGGVAEAPPTGEGTEPVPVTALEDQVPPGVTTGAVPPLGNTLAPGRPVEFDSGKGALGPVEDAGCVYDPPDPVGATAVEPALGPAVRLVELDMVKGGTAVEPIVPEAVFPDPLGPGAATLEFEIGNGGIVCPAGLLPGELIPDPRDVVRLGADGAVVSPDPPVGPASGAVVFDRGNGGFDSEEVPSGVSGTEAPVLSGAVPEIPPVGAIVWPPGPPVVLVRGNGAVENVFPSDDNEGVVARTLEFEANVEPPNVAVVFPVGKGGVVGDDPAPGGKLLKDVLEIVEVEELSKPDVAEPTGDIVKDSEATAVVPLEDGINGAVPVGGVGTVVLDNGNGGATVEVAISLPLPVALGELTPGAVGLPCPTGPDDGAPEAGLVVEPTTPLAEGGTGTVPVGPTVTVVLKVGNGANVIVDLAELGEGTMFDPVVGCGE
ncbi:uncharacterized protein PG986_010462 [Apiospora aurea]|uniref:Uncharacterized protein n=1 Tax=Apiospora aurea TaxID=335848 RepID=A0ABR1Q2B2_9PEZI